MANSDPVNRWPALLKRVWAIRVFAMGILALSFWLPFAFGRPWPITITVVIVVLTALFPLSRRWLATDRAAKEPPPVVGGSSQATQAKFAKTRKDRMIQQSAPRVP